MIFKIFKLFLSLVIFFSAVYFIYYVIKQPPKNDINVDSSIPLSTSSVKNLEQVYTAPTAKSKKTIEIIKPKSLEKIAIVQPINQIESNIKTVSDKNFEELVNSSIIQLYCGNLNSDETFFSDISRGTGIIVDNNGRLLTNRHVIYDENLKKVKNNCFVLKSPFPNKDSQKPKIYYKTEFVNYPLLEKFSDAFSKDKYYNDFAILKMFSKVNKESKISLLLGFDYAASEDYLVLENGVDQYNYLPIDWNYQPRNNDFLITLGYGVDASHLANKITSTIGKISGNVNISEELDPQILLIESNATTGFSGGALINPQSKGLVGLVSWITAGDVSGKYTVAIFRDFLRNLMIQDLNFDLKLIQNQ